MVLNSLHFYWRKDFRVGNKCLKHFCPLDEADDDDDPEYNFLEDRDEPDTEDFRTDRAVRITSESVSHSRRVLLWPVPVHVCLL